MTTQEFDKAVMAFVLAYRAGEIRTDSIHIDNGYDEWLEENLEKFGDEDSEKDFAQWKNKDGKKPRDCKEADEVETLWKEYYSRIDADDGDWVTINGTHTLIGPDGTAQGGGGLKGMSFSNAKSQKTGGGEKKEPESAFKTRNEYKPGATFQEWQRANMIGRDNPTRKALSQIYNEEGLEGVQKEYYSSRTLDATKDLRHISDTEADEILYDNMPQNVFQGWFRDANSEYKPRVINAVTATPEARNAALSIMYDNYRDLTGGKMGYDEFLKTPITMYRGGHGQDHTDDDVFSSFSFDRGVAEKFAGANGRVYETKIRPIDTWGSITTNKESEIMVPSWITPNKHKDSRDDDAVKSLRKKKPVQSFRSLLSAFWVNGNTYLSGKLLDKICKNAIIKMYGGDIRKDDEPDAWVTTETGAHIPLNEAGKAIGGAGGWAKGKDFSNAETSKPQRGKLRKKRTVHEHKKRVYGKPTPTETNVTEKDRDPVEKPAEAKVEPQKEEPTKGQHEKGTGEKPSARGENVPCKGFRNKVSAERHRKHWGEFGFKTDKEYADAAIEFIKQPVGGDIDGYMRENGQIVRFNRRTGEMGIGVPGKEVLTYFKAKYDSQLGGSRIKSANSYFDARKREEAYEDD